MLVLRTSSRGRMIVLQNKQTHTPLGPHSAGYICFVVALSTQPGHPFGRRCNECQWKLRRKQTQRTRCSSSVFVVLQFKLVSGWALWKRNGS